MAFPQMKERHVWDVPALHRYHRAMALVSISDRIICPCIPGQKHMNILPTRERNGDRPQWSYESLTSVERVSLGIYRRLSPLGCAEAIASPIRDRGIQTRYTQMRVRNRRAVSLHINKPWRRIILSNSECLQVRNEEKKSFRRIFS